MFSAISRLSASGDSSPEGSQYQHQASSRGALSRFWLSAAFPHWQEEVSCSGSSSESARAQAVLWCQSTASPALL